MSIENIPLKNQLDSLNSEQRQAALYNTGSLMVLAAAGSGKTKTLTCRIADIILNRGVPSQNILAVTFTNKAAKEMSDRLATMNINAKSLWIGTFHSICNKILKNHASLAGLKRGFYIIDQSEQLSMLKRIIKQQGQKAEAKDIQVDINKHKEGLLGGELKESVKAIYTIYQKECEAANCLDFSDLMRKVMKMFKEHPEIAAGYANKFQHILVDEFQDTNSQQYKWLCILASKHRCVFAVGDDDQSIYGFRGANPSNIDLFLNDFKAKLFKIEKNYRSDGYILAAANSLIENNTNRKGKKLVPTKDSKQKIIYKDCETDAHESLFIANSINKLRKDKVRYKNIAILYRTNVQSRQIERSLAESGIPYIIHGGLRFFDRSEVKSLMGYLRLAINPDDNIAFERVANVPVRGIGKSSIGMARRIAGEENVSIYKYVKELADSKLKAKFKPFIDLVEKISGFCEGKKLSEVMQIVSEHSGLVNFYKNDKESGPERLDNIYELVATAKSFEMENPKMGIEDFITTTTLSTDYGSSKENEASAGDTVKLMTIHSSKGLEFDYVFIPGLEEGLFPHKRSMGVGKNDKEVYYLLNAMEEERRLMYVAITRAKKMLVLLSCRFHKIAGEERVEPASRFLEEIDDSVIIKI